VIVRFWARKKFPVSFSGVQESTVVEQMIEVFPKLIFEAAEVDAMTAKPGIDRAEKSKMTFRSDADASSCRKLPVDNVDEESTTGGPPADASASIITSFEIT
jgi:hypothetical protein